MAKRPPKSHYETEPTARHIALEVALADGPRQTLGDGELRELVAMLGVARSHHERAAVLLVAYVGTDTGEAGKRLGLAPRQVRDLVESVATRLALGREHAARAAGLRRLEAK